MIGGKLNHPVIIFRAQIHEVIVDRVYYLPLYMHLVMQMRTGALARTPYPSYHFSRTTFLPNFVRKSLKCAYHV